uniref:Protein cramped-like protein n=1 Tax=Magallana gigas TaxID=29159 RepID=K1QWZ4_MAGGI
MSSTVVLTQIEHQADCLDDNESEEYREADLIVFDSCSKGIGRLQQGDEILSVNGESFQGITNDRAVAILRQASASNHVEMAVARDDQSKSEFLEILEKQNGLSFPCTPVPMETQGKMSSNISSLYSVDPSPVHGSMTSTSDPFTSVTSNESSRHRHMSKSRKLSLDPTVRLKIEKLQVALRYLGLEPTEEQEVCLKDQLTVDSAGTVNYGDFVAVVRDVFKEELQRKKIDPRAMLFAANDITDFVEPPSFKHSVSHFHSSGDEYSEIRQDRDRLQLEVQRLRKAESAMKKVEIAERAQREASNVEKDYEEVVQLLEAEVNVPSNAETQQQMAVFSCQLKKLEAEKKTYEVATEKLLQFAENVHEAMVSQGNNLGATKGDPARGNRPPAYLGRHKQTNPKTIAAEAKEVVTAVRSIIEKDPLPYGWEEAYTADGLRYYIKDEIPQLWLPSHGKTNDPDPCSEYWIGPVRTSFLAISLHHSGPLDLPPGGASTREEEDTAAQQEKASKSANVKSTPSTSSNRNNGEARVGAFTRSRIVKKPRRDFSPPESPVKKQTPKETKISTPETKTKRQWELWSSDDKDAFFEALFEHGKDFDAIQNWIATKCRRKNVNPGLIKNKDQVRHLYYRTWHKISKFIDVDTEVKKEIQELYGLINYGVLRKKIKGVLNEKVGAKLNDLVYTGCTAVKVRGKNVRIKTPMCNALKKLNNIDDNKSESSEKVPDKICVEMTPKTNAAWSFVQELATNPRVRMLLKGDRKLSSVMNYMSSKWKPHRVKLKESLDGENDMNTVLMVYPHRDCEVTPVSLHSIKETKVNLAFNHYKENTKNLVTVSKGKKMEAVAPTCDSSSVDAGESLVTGTFDSPKSTKSGKDSTSKTDSGSSYSVDVGAIVDGDNAMFPDTLLSLTQKKDNGLNKEGISNTIELSSVEDTDGCVPMEMEVLQESGKVIGCDSDKKADPTAEELAAIESRRLKEALEGGLSVDKADMTLAELYLMFGKEGKLRMEYEWCKEEVIPEHLCNMLRRLVNLATIQFTDINTKSPNTSNSPCHACGMVKSKSRVSNSRGQKSRCPLTSKYGEGYSDASTQTTANKKVDNSVPKEAVFRVPVCSPAFLQRNLSGTVTSKPSQPQRGMKKIRTNRKQLSIQRNILPKQPMMTVLRPSGQQPLSIPVCPQMGLVSVPNNVRLQPKTITTTGTPGGTPVQLNVQPQSPGNNNNNIAHLLRGIDIDLSQSSAAASSSENITQKDVTISRNTLSPPNISTLLDMSLSNLPTGSAENSDKLIDLAIGNSSSNTTFSTLLESQNRDVLNTPKKNPSKYSSPPGSPTRNPWLNSGEDGGDLTFMNLLTDSPLKPPHTYHVSTAPNPAIQTTPLFSESSRDSIMGRLDVDGTIQSVLYDNSIDYAVKFQDLAAHISGNSDSSLLRKTDSSG